MKGLFLIFRCKHFADADIFRAEPVSDKHGDKRGYSNEKIHIPKRIERDSRHLKRQKTHIFSVHQKRNDRAYAKSGQGLNKCANRIKQCKKQINLV